MNYGSAYYSFAVLLTEWANITGVAQEIWPTGAYVLNQATHSFQTSPSNHKGVNKGSPSVPPQYHTTLPVDN